LRDRRINLLLILAIGLSALTVLLLPVISSGYYRHILTLTVIDILLAVSFRAIQKMGGWNFAHIAIMGIGGYTSALLTVKLGWSFWLGLPMGGIMASLFALLISWPCLRTEGFYFFLSTFAAGEAIRQVWIMFEFFGGANGFFGLPHPETVFRIRFDTVLSNYYLVVAICSACLWLLYRLEKSRLGNTIKSITSNPELCESIGINTWAHKASTFIVGSFFTGVAGVLFAHYNGLVTPKEFSVLYTYKIITAVIVGGTAAFSGPIVGVIFLTGLTEIFRDLEQWVPLLYGIVIIGILLLFPEGLQSIPRRLRGKSSVKKPFHRKSRDVPEQYHAAIEPKRGE